MLLWYVWLLHFYLYHILLACFLSYFDSINLLNLESIKVSVTVFL